MNIYFKLSCNSYQISKTARGNQEQKWGPSVRRNNSLSLFLFIITRRPTTNSRKTNEYRLGQSQWFGSVRLWSNHIASFRLDPCPLNRGERRGGTEPGNQGRTLQRPPPFEGPVLRAVLSKIK